MVGAIVGTIDSTRRWFQSLTAKIAGIWTPVHPTPAITELSPMSDNSNVGAVFAAFVEAQKAMQRLPEAEAELARKAGELQVTYDRLQAQFEANDKLMAKLNDLQSALAAKEAELAQATFRETEARGKLDTLVSVLKGTVDEATAAIDLVQPPKQQETEPAPVNPAPDPDFGFYGEQSAPTTPPSAPADTDGSNSPVSSAPSDGGGEVDIPGVYHHSIGFVHETPEAARSPEEFPTTATGSESNGSPPTQSAAPYANKGYWEKPDGMTWQAWAAGGGNVPYWVTP